MSTTSCLPRKIAHRVKMKPLVEAIALALLGFASASHAATPVNSNWFSSARAVNNARSERAGQVAINEGLEAARLRQQAAAKQTLQHSVANLGRTAAAIAAQQAAQNAARANANQTASSVPDGLGQGGLWDRDANGNLLTWTGANRAVQTQNKGKTTVAIKQTRDKAILNWDSFNVGRNTTVDFQQNSSDAVLNRVVGADTRPSQILGAVKGDGTVMVVNQNGVIFSGSSQINVRNLVVAAAKISDDQFTRNGLYADTNGSQPTFTDALGDIVIHPGAQITTHQPASSTVGGGYVMLLGANVNNGGQITTQNGQAALAAGDSFYIRKGVGTESNVDSTTAGNEISTLRTANSPSGRVENNGLITATTGDITLTGHDVVQNGVAIATTSTRQRGTVHLSTRASDSTGSVTLTGNGVTAVLVDNSTTAYDSQRDTALEKLNGNNSNLLARGNFDNLSTLVDRRDLSRIEIVSGNTVDFGDDSLTLATGGEIAVTGAKRTLVDNRATLDVAGAIGVKVAMESNNLAVNIQGNEQRDSASNRDSGKLNNTDVWVDKRTLVFVPAGTNGYSTDRWYTAGGLLEVSGYLATSGHAAGEWLAQGGTITVSGGDVVTRAGSDINLSGGTLDVQSGYLRQSWLKGSDGRLYELSRAPGDLLYDGLYQGYQVTSARWGQTNTYYNPLIGASQRYQPGYTVGRDAGKLVVSTTSAVLEGNIISDVYQGDDQTEAARAGVDGYNQSHYAVARKGQLIVGQYTPIYDATAGMLRYALSAMMNNVTLKANANGVAQDVQLQDDVPADRLGALQLDTDLLNDARLGALRIAARETLAVKDALNADAGGEIVLYAPAVEVAADLTANGGSIHLGNVLKQIYANPGDDPLRDTEITPPDGLTGGVRVGEGVTLDASGMIGDLRERGAQRDSEMAWIDGGTINIRSTGSVTLAKNSLLDVTSGAIVNSDGSVSGGKGGNVKLGSGLIVARAGNSNAVLTLDGTIRGYGVRGGGTLEIESASSASIGGQWQDGLLKPGETVPFGLVLLDDYQVKAGERLPADYHYLSTVARPGEDVAAKPSLVGITLASEWTLPYAVRGNSYIIFYRLPGGTSDQQLQVNPAGTANGAVYKLPAGATITTFVRPNNFPLDYIVPANVFPDGIPTEATPRTAVAGSLLASDALFKAGTVIEAGMSVARPVAVANTTHLDTALFQSGFANYDVRAHHGLLVWDNVTLAAAQPVLYADAKILQAGGSAEQALQWQLPELWQADNNARSVTQRGGASLTLSAGVKDGLTSGITVVADTGDKGTLTIARGARLLVDPGSSISLNSRGNLNVDGLLQARGGNITLLGPQTAGAKSIKEGGGLGDPTASQRAITIGEHAVLDASAISWSTRDTSGHPFGVVTDGGNIVVGGTLLESLATRALASDAFVVIRKGALLDASGTATVLDIDGRGSQLVASNGGAISIASNNGLLLDGTLRALAGGANAAGGSLTVALEAPNYNSSNSVNKAVLALRELRLVQQVQASPGNLTYGDGQLAASQVSDGGFSVLTVYSNGAISVDGDVDLTLGRELRLYAGALTLAQGADPASKVSLTAPYLLLGGVSDNIAIADGFQRPAFSGGVSSLPSQAVLSASADLIDIKGMVGLGLNATRNGINAERAGFAQLLLNSRGDLRFVNAQAISGTSQGVVSELRSPGDITLRAAQIYPASGVSARVMAGMQADGTFAPDSWLTLARSQAGTPAQPYSVFGSLRLGAANIAQNGVLRAPLGTIVLGGGVAGGEQGTRSVTLGSGSLTSVSANGLVMPWGGTSDGVTWYYQGEKVALTGIGNGPTLTLAATHVAVNDGAVLDLSGGGDLLGAGFVSGRGGSTDARFYPLVQVGRDGFTLPALDRNPVYAIIPGYDSAYAPADNTGAVSPLAGQQITLANGDIPGLAAGTYTLLPSNYALLPGAFRVELNGGATGLSGSKTVALRNGSWASSGRLTVANTAIADSLTRQFVITPAAVLRKYAQYNETPYADFVQAQAERAGGVRAVLPADAKTLSLLSSGNDNTFSFKGLADFTPAKGGYGGTASLMIGDDNAVGSIEILARGATRSRDFDGIAVYADDLNAIGASRLTIGGTLVSNYQSSNGQNLSRYLQVIGREKSVVLREGAVLAAPEVFLFAVGKTGGITLETGSGINTIGQGDVAYDSTDGFVYQPLDSAVVAASNGWLDMLAPQADPNPAPADKGAGPINIGACGITCRGITRLYSSGTLLAATLADFDLGEAVRYGTRNLVLGVGTVNAGSSADLNAVAARGALTRGLVLNQTVLDRLLQGDTAYGAPALERLVLTAGESFNFFGNISLNTLDAAPGKSKLANLVLSTPAIYGYGDARDVATITTGKLTWAGLKGDAPAPVKGGRGTGTGSLRVNAQVVEFGYDENAQPNAIDNFGRTIRGFSDVTLAASDRITANQHGSLQVFGDATLRAPLVTGEGGSVNSITASGALRVVAPPSGGGDANKVTLAKNEETGAELNLTGNTVLLDTTIALPSGKLTATATGDVTLADSAWLDLAGRALKFYDATSYSWGGDVALTSKAGNIVQSAGSTIDLSAQNNNAGTLRAVALADAAGRVDLHGTLLGSSNGHYNAGGTRVPYREGVVIIRAQTLGDGGALSESFAALNNRLNVGGFFGERSFQLKRGDLRIGDEVRAHNVAISLDGGHLNVVGTIDASGEQVGAIRLAAANGLTLGGSAQLDAHGTVLCVDSYGAIIDSPNRAVVELDSGHGTLTLANGARIDLRHGTASTAGDGQARGTLDLTAPRIDDAGQADTADSATFGDIAIDARGAIDVLGAKSIAVYGRQIYRDAPSGNGQSADGHPWQEITQTWLDGKNAEANRFINAALANNTLLNSRLAGLNNSRYADVFHLRPAIEVVSATANGDVIVSGDLDLSGYRYASLNPHTPKTGVAGSGEVGQLTLRAGGNLSIFGSVTDGFAKPSTTPDDEGWLLTPGVQAFASDVVVPVAGVTLDAGTKYPAGKTLNYAITAGNVTLPVGTTLPVAVTLDSPLTLPAGTVLASNVLAADGQVLLAAGTVVGADGLALPAGAQLLAGARLPVAVTLSQLTWPKGVALPVEMVQVGSLTLPVGALIASGTDVVLPDDALFVDLRPKNAQGEYIARSNWAVADMLPAGSQSWNIRVVGGSDLQAADSRLTRDDAGDVQLADTHYISQKQWKNEGGPVWYWADNNSWGFEGGTPFNFDDVGFDVCGFTPSECVKVTWVWADGNFYGGAPGKPVNFDDWGGYNVCELEPGQCVNVSTPGENVLVGITPTSPIFSVLRTGTGDLEVIAGGNVAMRSAWGVYTAGTQSKNLEASWNRARGKVAEDGTVLGNGAGDAAPDYEALVSGDNSLYQAWYPQQGGNLTIVAGGNLTGDTWSAGSLLPTASASVGNWLWRQGSGNTAGVDNVPTAWWINFGTYTWQPQTGSEMPMVSGFTGFGTLGGGNLSVRVGGDAGVLTTPAVSGDYRQLARSQGVVLAIGSTGRVERDGSIAFTGGGDLDVRIGGGWNSHAQARVTTDNGTLFQMHDLYGSLVNLRGDIAMTAAQIGTNQLFYGINGRAAQQDNHEVRPSTPWTSSASNASGGLTLVLGDSTAAIGSRGDLVLGATLDAGLLDMANYTAYRGAAGSGENGQSWFSLWTDNTALNVQAAGGNLAFDTRPSDNLIATTVNNDFVKNGGWYLLPGNVSAVADSGSIYYGSSAAYTSQSNYSNSGGLLLAPLGSGNISLLAGESLYGGGFAISRSGAETSSIATVFHPAFYAPLADGTAVTNLSDVSPIADAGVYPLFAFGLNTVGSTAGIREAAQAPSRFYALNGDIVGLRTGSVVSFQNAGVRANQVDYVAAGPVRVRAGRDIVYTGTRGDETLPPLFDFANDISSATVSGNLIVHTQANDVSLFEAGRDILFANIDIAGPGTLEVSAGRNIIQNDVANLTSIGPVVSGDHRPGASIVVQAGMGSVGAQYDALLARYLDIANRAESGVPLADQPGKVVKTYDQELITWLAQRYGFSGDANAALRFFANLAPEQQRIFARQIYFAELLASGREYNDPDGPRSGSYLRGRNAIAVFFPQNYSGELLMYGASGIHTNLGGDIQILTPGGGQTYGVEGEAPPATAGLITRGSGNIALFSNDSILLGQSRIMTTFGGNIQAWSAQGDINAGRGSKTTVVYTPPRRVYDNAGNVTLSPDVPSTGAGIATLNPIAEVPPGDVDLIAPQGTIDAGEAGIRVSGSVNIAALHVINAANIQVQGDSAGIPVMATVNVGALSSASAAASTASQAAQAVVRQQQNADRQGQRSSVVVQILGFGDQPL